MQVAVGPVVASLHWLSARWRWLAGLAVVLLLVAGPTYPGRANNDTINMVRNMDAGAYTDWWSPLLTMAWRPFYEVGFGLGFILLGQIAVVFAAIGALIRPLFTRQWPAIATAVVLCLFPTTYAMLVNVIRDTWFTAAVVATTAVVHRTRRPAPIHGALLLLGFLAIVAARQNGVAVVVVLAFVAAARWGLLSLARPTARHALWLGMSLAVGVVFFAVVQLVVRATDVEATGPETATFYVDLDEMSTRVGEMLVPDVYVVDSLSLDELAEERNYSADNVKDRVRLRLPPDDRPAAADAWRDAVTEHPWVYLQARWQMFTRQLGWSGAPLEAHYPTEVSAHVYPPWSTRLSTLSTSYLEMFDGGDWQQGGFLHRPWLYVAAAVAAAVRFGRRWTVLYTIPALQASVFAGLFFLSPISKTRLVYPVFVLGLVAVTYLLVGGRALLEEQVRRRGAVADPLAHDSGRHELPPR